MTLQTDSSNEKSLVHSKVTKSYAQRKEIPGISMRFVVYFLSNGVNLRENVTKHLSKLFHFVSFFFHLETRSKWRYWARIHEKGTKTLQAVEKQISHDKEAEETVADVAKGTCTREKCVFASSESTFQWTSNILPLFTNEYQLKNG